MISEQEFEYEFQPLFRGNEPSAARSVDDYILKGRIARLNILLPEEVNNLDLNEKQLGLSTADYELVRRHIWSITADDNYNLYARPGFSLQATERLITLNPWIYPDEIAEYLIQAKPVEDTDGSDVILDKFLLAYDFDNYEFIESEFISQDRIINMIEKIALEDNNEILIAIINNHKSITPRQ